MTDILPTGSPDFIKGPENGPGSNKGRNETIEHPTILPTGDEFVGAQTIPTNPAARLALARTTTSPTVLDALVTIATNQQNLDINLLVAVAQNQSTFPATLTSLTRPRGNGILLPALVRGAVGGNRRTPIATLRELAALTGNANSTIRWEVARNPSAPVDLLNTLIRDPDQSVVAVARDNLARRR